ncbi:putative splicing factor YJU2B isoform X1 [Calonectris borealis]|uniref:putative splicing factor YJU2B isoform X1 n=2 Tax=Calonectris borealis TaxID=1323832 RepID=UPI003F4C8E0E
MGERKGTNKYYPPDFDPAKHGSLNKYHHSHPLRERARKLAQGILVIRFEMPYNVWCDGCQNHIGMGVRYNAEKKKVGTYYTTPIYRFRMKCHLCVNYIEMQTDPAGCDYVIVSGARRKEERWDMRDNEQVLPTEREEKEKLETDAMFRLEHGAADRAALQRAAPTLASLQEAQSAWKDDFALNSRLRRRFREEKKTLREEEEEAAALQAKTGLSIPLVREAEEDRRLAALLKYHSPDSYEEKQRMKRTEISSRSWFPPAAGGRAGEALRKLGLGGRALRGQGGPPATPAGLGIVRRRSGEGPEAPAEPGGLERGETTPRSPPAPTGEPQRGGDAGTAPPAPPPTASLVADYSDSSSEAESA